MSIHVCQQTVKQLTHKLHRAFQAGHVPLVKRLHARLLVADDYPLATVAARVGVGHQTMYTWITAFLVDRWTSFYPRRSPGLPATLTAFQRQRLCNLLAAGTEAAGYAPGCWKTALVHDLMWREVQRQYNPHYLATLLRTLGFSYQKARFVSDHLDEQQRQHWVTTTWPALVQEARRRGAMLVFADEASFTQWGFFGSTWAKRGQQPLVNTSGKRKG